MMQVSRVPLTIDQIAQYAPSAVATQPHGSRSDRYAFIPTLEVIQGMERAGFLPFAASQSRTRDISRKEFTKHMLRFRNMGSRAENVGDIIPEIVLVNSHDGSSVYKLLAGIMRLVCGNGMVVAESTVASVSIRHTGDVVKDVVDASNALVEHSGKVFSRIADWQKLLLSREEQLALAASAHTLRFGDAEGKTHTPITPAQLLYTRRPADSGTDLWKTFNRIQENVIRGGLSARDVDQETGRIGRRSTMRAVKGIDQDVKLNRALWQLAERMSELKGGNAAATTA